MNSLEQAQKLIAESQSILIEPAQPIQGDGLASALALFFTLKKLEKNANLFIQSIPEKFRFLTDTPVSRPRDFVISVDGSGKEISEMRYEKNDRGLKIYLTLGEGEISEKDVSFSFLSRNYDLLIVFDNNSVPAAGPAPILNIAGLAENAPSLAETTTKLIRSLDAEANLIDENIATCLLAGIVVSSQNFRQPEIKPETLAVAAYLMEKGADHQKIVHHLYKQKSLPQIKILGRVLENLSFDEKKELYCTALTRQDFQDCQSGPKDLGRVIEELKFNFNYFRPLLILWESHSSPVLIRGIIHAAKTELVERILENYQGVAKGEGALFSIKDDGLASVKEKILNIL